MLDLRSWVDSFERYEADDFIDVFEDVLVSWLNDVPDDWSVGISNDPDRRLVEHGVDLENGVAHIITTSSVRVARMVEDHFLALGLRGGPGGGNEESKSVYIYRRTNYTTP